MEFLQKNSKYLGYTGYAGCILMILGNFLPFATATVSLFGYSQSESIKFIDGDGVFVLIAAIVTAILLYFKKEKFSLIPTAIALAVTINAIVNVESELGNTMGMATISYGLGLWIIIIGVILAAGHVVLNHIMNKNTKAKE